MSSPISMGTQRLKVTHGPDGSVSALLSCSVSLNLSMSHRLVFEERVAEVAVESVLNPWNEVFLADEVQRLMRLGLAAKLRQELCSERVKNITVDDSCALQTVHFDLGDLAAGQQDLAVDVEATQSADAAIEKALERLQSWECSLSRSLPQSWVLEELELADLVQAPLLRGGLKQLQVAT